jgi:peptide/nickel transport system ATP-binding protein
MTGNAVTGNVLLAVEHLTQRYRVPGGWLEAVSDVSFSVRSGETLGLIGESGCGKSSTGRAVLQLPRPSAGSVRFAGRELTGLGHGELREVRRKMQIIFQDPTASLNPRRRIGAVVAEGLAIERAARASRTERADEMLKLVGLEPAQYRDRRAHQLSGGQCQRVSIARALMVEPELLICDEPVAGLDVSVQGQILNLLERIRRDSTLSMLFISHNISVVHQVSDRIAVMYLGRIAEIGSASAVVRRPAHPYSRALLDSVPVADPDAPLAPRTLAGEVPSPLAPPSGCRFRTRCPRARDRCAVEVPELRPVGPDQSVACHFPLSGDPAAS